jgi:hypothetical protein
MMGRNEVNTRVAASYFISVCSTWTQHDKVITAQPMEKELARLGHWGVEFPVGRTPDTNVAAFEIRMHAQELIAP